MLNTGARHESPRMDVSLTRTRIATPRVVAIGGGTGLQTVLHGLRLACAAGRFDHLPPDWLTAVVNWVEKGTAPEMIVGAHKEGGQTTRTRPICMYPNVARYKGTGSIDDAANFTCGAK